MEKYCKKCHNPKQHDESPFQIHFHSLTTLEYITIPNSSYVIMENLVNVQVMFYSIEYF